MRARRDSVYESASRAAAGAVQGLSGPSTALAGSSPVLNLAPALPVVQSGGPGWVGNNICTGAAARFGPWPAEFQPCRLCTYDQVEDSWLLAAAMR